VRPAGYCRYPDRLYGSLGVDLWMLKLHSSLAVLAGTARTFTGHVSEHALESPLSESSLSDSPKAQCAYC
jgi:hypothetical protein